MLEHHLPRNSYPAGPPHCPVAIASMVGGVCRNIEAIESYAYIVLLAMLKPCEESVRDMSNNRCAGGGIRMSSFLSLGLSS